MGRQVVKLAVLVGMLFSISSCYLYANNLVIEIADRAFPIGDHAEFYVLEGVDKTGEEEIYAASVGNAVPVLGRYIYERDGPCYRVTVSDNQNYEHYAIFVEIDPEFWLMVNTPTCRADGKIDDASKAITQEGDISSDNQDTSIDIEYIAVDKFPDNGQTYYTVNYASISSIENWLDSLDLFDPVRNSFLRSESPMDGFQVSSLPALVRLGREIRADLSEHINMTEIRSGIPIRPFKPKPKADAASTSRTETETATQTGGQPNNYGAWKLDEDTSEAGGAIRHRAFLQGKVREDGSNAWLIASCRSGTKRFEVQFSDSTRLEDMFRGDADSYRMDFRFDGGTAIQLVFDIAKRNIGYNPTDASNKIAYGIACALVPGPCRNYNFTWTVDGMVQTLKTSDDVSVKAYSTAGSRSVEFALAGATAALDDWEDNCD